MELTLRKCKVC